MLSAVEEQHPQTSRLIDSGYADPDSVVKCLATAHQFIAKPFRFRELADLLDFLCSLSELLNEERI